MTVFYTDTNKVLNRDKKQIKIINIKNKTIKIRKIKINNKQARNIPFSFINIIRYH